LQAQRERRKAVDFSIPKDVASYLEELDDFIEKVIKPLERKDDNIRFFDHRREWARTDFENQGLPRHEWEALLGEMRKLADKAGHYRYASGCTTICKTKPPSSAIFRPC